MKITIEVTEDEVKVILRNSIGRVLSTARRNAQYLAEYGTTDTHRHYGAINEDDLEALSPLVRDLWARVTQQIRLQLIARS